MRLFGGASAEQKTGEEQQTLHILSFRPTRGALSMAILVTSEHLAIGTCCLTERCFRAYIKAPPPQFP